MSRAAGVSAMHETGLLSPAACLLLRAISHTGPEAVAAYSAWRALGPLDAAHGESHRVLPMLVELIGREGLDDLDLARMRGVARQVWTYNVLRLRLLFDTLDALESRGIGAVLMKGAALFARAPELERRRVAADYDILVLPEDIPNAVSVLRARGFIPPGHAWEDFSGPLIDSVDAGVEIKRGPRRGLDLHWRPLWNIRDPALGERYSRDAREAVLHGRPVRIPNATDQLFCAMARCEPWDRIECFSRAVEGYCLLTTAGGEVDWDAFLGLTRQYGLECTAGAYLDALRTHAELDIPLSVTVGLAQTTGAEMTREWRIRAIAPGRRSSSEHIALQRQDFAFGRSGRNLRPPGQSEERLRARARPRLHTLWELARQRIAGCPMSESPVFLEGASSPEILGRWTEGNWALVVVPLTAAQRQGEPLRINAHAYRGRRARTRILAAGGRGTVALTLVDGETEVDLAVPLQPIPELDGRGLLLFWLPHAGVPAEDGNSTDKRQLGLFIRRQWEREATDRAGALQTRLILPRRIWRRLPLPQSLRRRAAPMLGRALRRIMFRRLPPPLRASAIRPGNVVVSGFFSDVSGIARAARLTHGAVSDWPVPVVAHDLSRDRSGAKIAPADGGIWICHCNAPEAAEVMLSGTGHIWARRYRIGVWAYELERLPSDWARVLPQFHEIWAPSAFVANAVRAGCGKAGPLVRVMAHPFPAVDSDLPLSRVFPTERPFRFLAMFDMRSTQMRKNPMGAIRAFQTAFAPQSRSVSLLVKVVEAGFDAAAMAELTQAVAGWPNITLMTKHLSDSQTLAMIAEADCLVSLHRSEGFGLTIAEAMAVGTPAIVTNWSAPTEFTADAALAIGYRLVPTIDPTGRYEVKKARWAEPDAAAAAAAMARLATDQGLWMELSRAGLARAAERRAIKWSSDPYRRLFAS